MKKEDIERLPPELRPAAELCEKLPTEVWQIWQPSPSMIECDDGTPVACMTLRANYQPHEYQEVLREMEQKAAFIAESRTALPLALTWGLQVVEELETAKKVIAWANNSLYGSHGYFLSANGGAPDEHHLDSKIEDLKDRARKTATAEATIATLTRERDELITGLEPNGYPLWFNRAVHECPGCDPEDLCNGHYAMADRGWTGCENEIEAFRAALSHTHEGGK